MLLKAQSDVYFDGNMLFMILGKVMPYFLFCNSKALTSDEVFASAVEESLFMSFFFYTIYC